MIEIPEYCLALWKLLKKGPVDVHNQECNKARDVKELFNLGLIRVSRSEHLFPAVRLVLSDEGKKLVEAQS